MQFEIDIVSPHRELFQKARQMLLSYEGVVETKKPRITTYADGNGGVCHMRTMPHGIDFGFLKGARMEDEPRRLTGKGKAIRVLSLASMDADLVEYYLHQAIELNAK